MPEEKPAIDPVAQKLIEEAAKDVVLEARQKPNGQLQWRVPPNMVQATYLLKILEIAVAECLKNSLHPAGGSRIIKPS